MFMRMIVTGSIKTTLPKIGITKDFTGFVEKHSQTVDRSLVGILMKTLTIMKFDGSRIIHEHVIEMTNIVARLKSFGMAVNENFLGNVMFSCGINV
uniref:Retrovirus-related Pol polyprotein from transposon TNT 1-94 n=1 Tax=Cajanus cajan TaxID=3821 RepID=A0A151TME7_CAJCA|nr:hypothetical protein KK1_021841 [Cajanus cajan]